LPRRRWRQGQGQRTPPGQKLSASDIDGYLNDLNARLTKSVQVTNGNSSYSLGAVYCGKTGTNPNPIGGGYTAVKGLCQTACGGAATAHVCTSDEMVRSAQLGVTLAQGWFAAGIGGRDGSPGSPYITDCHGFTDTTSSGVTWNPSYNGPDFSPCTITLPILCCN
jgi:hypothetical protein